MSDPPVETGADGVQPRLKRTHVRWLDFAAAAVAILISVVSLAVSFYNAQSQQRMVAASSWPFLVYNTMEVGPKLTLTIENAGVGPARLKTLAVRYHGREVHGFAELLQVCCGLGRGGWPALEKVGGVTWESRPIGLYRPGDKNNILILDRSAKNAPIWEKLSRARVQLKFEACYCSVLNDCWTSDLDAVSDPKRVDRCGTVSSYQE
jgi:hypothetical protein